VALALAFAAGLHLWAGKEVALTFLTGYVIEESLSVDNIFVIVLIFDYFRVPRICQHRVLFYGILGALIMRGLFIGLGAVLIAQFHWILYIFGAMLVITGVRMAFRADDEFNGDDNPVVKVVRRFMPISKSYQGKHFFTMEAGQRVATPLLLVLVLVEVTDLIFAVDSIPAIFGVTQDPFIVFTSNIFAILGLRSLYFLLAAVVDRFYLLKYGLALILTFSRSAYLACLIVSGLFVLWKFNARSFSVALLAPMGFLVHRALSSVALERTTRHQVVAERIFDEMERGLSRLLGTLQGRGSALAAQPVLEQGREMGAAKGARLVCDHLLLDLAEEDEGLKRHRADLQKIRAAGNHLTSSCAMSRTPRPRSCMPDVGRLWRRLWPRVWTATCGPRPDQI
jgi:TerC family integral membrane protein